MSTPRDLKRARRELAENEEARWLLKQLRRRVELALDELVRLRGYVDAIRDGIDVQQQRLGETMERRASQYIECDRLEKECRDTEAAVAALVDPDIAALEAKL